MARNKDKLPISYYEILQVAENATDAEIRMAYHKLAKRFHPDRNRDERKLAELRFKIINEAYANLKTKEKRAAYRRILNSKKRPTWTKPATNDNTSPAKTSVENAGFFAGLARFFRPTKVEV